MTTNRIKTVLSATIRTAVRAWMASRPFAYAFVTICVLTATFESVVKEQYGLAFLFMAEAAVFAVLTLRHAVRVQLELGIMTGRGPGPDPLVEETLRRQREQTERRPH